MEQRLSLVTLGVADHARSVAFYERLGWRPSNDWRAQDVAFFQLQSLGLALWDRAALAADAHVPISPPGAVVLAWNGRSRHEVDEALADARAAGAGHVRDAAPTEWGGYAGGFVDVDGHPWEIAHNPHWRVAGDGSVQLD